MEKIEFTDPAVKPENNVLEKVLGKKYNYFLDFVNKLNEQNLMIEWNYYNDGKCWLGKILYKKKNLCWLAIWSTGLKITFYFMERTIEGLYELNIDEEIKNLGENSKRVGKFIPITLLIGSKKKINIALKVLEYKKHAK